MTRNGPPFRPAPDEATRLFESYATLARRNTFLALPSGEPRTYLYDLMPTHFLRPAKYIRPVLCLAACGAYGGAIDEAIPSAVALELMHNAFLIHDDIQDESSHRRGHPTMWTEHGSALALNAGNALAAHASRHLAREIRPLGRHRSLAVVEEFDRMVRETTEGQALELGWRRHRRFDVRVKDYLLMVTKKTAWYTVVAPIRLGAVIGSGGRAELDRVTRYGCLVGAMFQIKNDLASISTEFGDDGHEANGDIYEGKATLSLIHLLGADDVPKRERASISSEDLSRIWKYLLLERSERASRQDEANWIVDQMQSNGSIDYAKSCLEELAIAADKEADDAFGHLPESPDRTLLLSLVGLLRSM